jgi:hypothetical protein
LAISGVLVRTRVHVTAMAYTYAVNEINRVFLEAIISGGLDSTDYSTNMSIIENGLRTWMALRQLEAAYLEVYDPRSGEVRTRIDLLIEFTDSGDERYSTDIDRVRGELGKAGNFAGCRYRVVVTTTDGAAAIRGWGETTLGNVGHLTRYDVGGVIGTAAVGVSMSILR